MELVEMPFKVNWTGATGSRQETLYTAQEAHAKVMELENDGFGNIVVTDEKGQRVDPEDLLQPKRPTSREID
jgi:hypothetical protein